jgi:hypothetical protein
VRGLPPVRPVVHERRTAQRSQRVVQFLALAVRFCAAAVLKHARTSRLGHPDRELLPEVWPYGPTPLPIDAEG